MKKKVLKFGLLTSAVFLVDRFSKQLAFNLGLPLVYNKGIALYLFSVDFSFLNIGILLILFIFLIFYDREFFFKSKEGLLGFSLVLGGALSNLVDRLFFKAVVDFIRILFFPSFNLADLFICSGTAIIFFRKAKKGELLRALT